MRAQWRIGLWMIVLAVPMVAPPDARAQAARVSVTVKDIAGDAVEGVTVTVTCAAKADYQSTKVTDKKGRVSVAHIDSQQTYTYTLEKEGFQTQVVQVRPDYTETTRLEVVLRPREMVETGPEARPESGGGRALEAFNEGAEAQQRGNLELAERKFRQAAQLNPAAPEPHIALAVVAHQRGDYPAAAAEAEAALAITPDNQQALLLRYDAYRLQGDTGKAAEAAEALRQAGYTTAAAGTLFTEGITEYRAGNTEGAVEKFQRAVELDPELVNGYLMLGNIALIQGDPEQAAAMATTALELDPGNSNALKIRYDAARHLGDAAASRAALDALIEADPEWASTDLFNHAVELYNADEMADAAAALESVVELRPDDGKAHFLLGMAKLNLGDTEDAKTHLTRFLELAPDDPDAALAREMLEFAAP